MNQKIKAYLRRLPLIPLAAIIGASLLGLIYVLQSSSFEVAFLLWIFGWAVLVPYLSQRFFLDERGDGFSRAFGFALLVFSCVFSYSGYSSIGAGIVFVSVLAYFGNLRIFAISCAAVSVWVFAVPHADYLHFFLSYPMRLAGAWLSAPVLSLMGIDAVANGTMVEIAGRQIAITSACSGIEQLEAMLLAGWILAVMMQSDTLGRVLQMLAIIPIILLFNCLRIVATLAGCELVGEVFLSDWVHIAMGIAVPVLSICAYILLGLAISRFFKFHKEQGGNIE